MMTHSVLLRQLSDGLVVLLCCALASCVILCGVARADARPVEVKMERATTGAATGDGI